MKLTTTLHHAKTFWWGKGFGPKPRTNTDNFYWNQQWKAKRRRQVEIIEQKLPEGVTPVDANVFVKECLSQEFGNLKISDPQLPWPASERPLKGLYF